MIESGACAPDFFCADWSALSVGIFYYGLPFLNPRVPFPPTDPMVPLLQTPWFPSYRPHGFPPTNPMVPSCQPHGSPPPTPWLVMMNRGVREQNGC